MEGIWWIGKRVYETHLDEFRKIVEYVPCKKLGGIYIGDIKKNLNVRCIKGFWIDYGYGIAMAKYVPHMTVDRVEVEREFRDAVKKEWLRLFVWRCVGSAETCYVICRKADCPNCTRYLFLDWLEKNTEISDDAEELYKAAKAILGKKSFAYKGIMKDDEYHSVTLEAYTGGLIQCIANARRRGSSSWKRHTVYYLIENNSEYGMVGYGDYDRDELWEILYEMLF